MTIGKLLVALCELPPAQRDREEVRRFVMRLPERQSAEATDEQMKRAMRLKDQTQ